MAGLIRAARGRLILPLAALVLLAAVLLGLGRAGDPRLPAAPDAGAWWTADGGWAVELSTAGVLTVWGRHEPLFVSEPGWRVRGFLTGDLDADGADELALLVWRRGFYGPSRPFWQTGRDTRYSQHIFLYRWQDGGVRPFWMSSGLNPEVASWSMTGDGCLAIRTTGGEDTLWGWRGWGLERLDAPLRRL